MLTNPCIESSPYHADRTLQADSVSDSIRLPGVIDNPAACAFKLPIGDRRTNVRSIDTAQRSPASIRHAPREPETGVKDPGC